MKINAVVDLKTRAVRIPSGIKISAFDHNVDVVEFSLEQDEEFQFDTSSIRIAAKGPDKSRHDYAIDPNTISVEEETGYVTFEWEIPQGVTEMPIGTFKYGDTGQLIFAVCAEIISGSTVSKAWHSDDGIITVVAHLEPEAGGGEDPEEEATNAQKIGQLQTDVAVMGTQIGALANGSPTPAGTVAEMTDESAVYLYTGSETGYTAGDWYYYDGTAWTAGGTYGGAVTSTTFNQHGVPADDFAVGEALADKADAVDLDTLDDRVTALESGSGSGPTNMANGSAVGSVRGINTASEDSSYTMGDYAFAEGLDTKASGDASHAEGGATQAIGAASHAEGIGTHATGGSSHAEGNGAQADGDASHAEGSGATATGTASHAEGSSTQAIGQGSHAEGFRTKTSGDASHAEGNGAQATGSASHAECSNTQATGDYSHAEGVRTRASGIASHAEGFGTIAQGHYQHTSGSYNIPQGRGDQHEDSDYVVIIGNGSDGAQSNAFAMKWDGTFVFANGTEITPAQFTALLALLDN